MEAKIVYILPLANGVFKEELSYYTAKDISVGDLVKITIRKTQHVGIVSKIDEAKLTKAYIKNASFNLRKVDSVVGPSIYSEPFLETAKHIGKFHIASTGQALKAFTSKKLFDHLKYKDSDLEKQTKGSGSIRPEKFIFQNNFKERMGFYKTYIRESFAKNKSLVFVVPQHHHTTTLKDELQKGVEEHCVTLNNKMSEKKIVSAMEKVRTSDHPLLIITTPPFLALTRPDIGSYIIEFEHEKGFVTVRRPHIDARHFVEVLAHITRARLLIGDTILRSETLHRFETDEYNSIGTPNFRLHDSAKQSLVDMRKEKNPNHPCLGLETAEKISYLTRRGENVLVHTVRSGLASTTYCGDCGEMMTYEGAPLVLYTDPKTQKRFFKSPKFKKVIDAQTICPNCKSWNLRTYGVGSETVEEALNQLLPDVQTFRVDAMKTRTDTQIKKEVREFENTKGSILIATEKAFKHIREPLDLTVIASLDTLFSIPQFDMYEQIVQRIITLHNKTKGSLLIQTRQNDKTLLQGLNNKKLTEFFDRDIKEREIWDYPPFSRILKLTYTSSEINVRQAAVYLRKTFKDFDPYIFIARTPHKEGSKTVHMVVKLSKKDWPLMTRKDGSIRQALYERFEELSPQWTITIDPHNV